jgi:flagellar basal body-associated protein FliL
VDIQNEELLAQLSEKQKRLKKNNKSFIPLFIIMQILILGASYCLLDVFPKNPQFIIIIMIGSILSLLMIGVFQVCFMNFKSWKENAEKEAVLNLLKNKSK